MVTTSLRVTRPLLVVVVVVSFTTVPSGWVVVVVLLVVELELVVTGEGATTTGAGVLFEDEQPAIKPQTTTSEAKPAKLRIEPMPIRLPTPKSRVKRLSNGPRHVQVGRAAWRAKASTRGAYPTSSGWVAKLWTAGVVTHGNFSEVKTSINGVNHWCSSSMVARTLMKSRPSGCVNTQFLQ